MGPTSKGGEEREGEEGERRGGEREKMKGIGEK